MVRLFFLSFFALWNFEFPAKIKKGGGEDPPDPLPPSLARSAVIAIFVQRPAVIVAPRRVTIEATSLPLSLMVGCCLLFGGTWYLCPLPLSSACQPSSSSSTRYATVDEADRGQSPMQPSPIFCRDGIHAHLAPPGTGALPKRHHNLFHMHPGSKATLSAPW